MLVHATEVLLVLCVLLTGWFVGYVIYRLVTDES
jgi:hypothetical protein